MSVATDSRVGEQNRQQPGALCVRGLSVSYQVHGRDFPALTDVDLDVAAGQVVALVGESGSGKSTLARAVIGLLPPNATYRTGSIEVGEVELLDQQSRRRGGFDFRRARSLAGDQVAMIPQDPYAGLNPLIRVGKQVTESASLRKRIGRGEREALAVDLLTRVGFDRPADRARQYPTEFSGGMRQRALIAAALCNDPALLIADEPTSALDVTVQQQILDDLSDLVSAAGTAVLLVTHDLMLAAERADTVVVLRHGRVVEVGAAATLLSHPEHSYTRQLVNDQPHLLALRNKTADQEAATGEPVLQARQVTKTFARRGQPQTTAVDRVDIDVRAGETVAVIGKSGSGKSTLGRILVGLERPDTGEIRFGGTDITGLDAGRRRRFRQTVQMVYQDPLGSLDPRMTVRRLVEDPLIGFGLGNARQRLEAVTKVLTEVGLPLEAWERRPGGLSGGQRQRVALARALVVEPEIVVLDESISALDVTVQAQILRLLNEIQHHRSIGLLLISHDLSVVRGFADRVIVMLDGQVIETNTAAQLFGNPVHPHTRALLSASPGVSSDTSTESMQ